MAVVTESRMRATYRLPQAAKGQYAKEYRLMTLWAHLASGDDVNTILRECGLSPAGSPPSVMRGVYDYRNDADQAGYAKEPYRGPTEQELADAELVTGFMHQLRLFQPQIHAALMARHRRMIDGQHYRLHAEWARATALYSTQRRQAHALLTKHCDQGYALLRQWMDSEYLSSRAYVEKSA